MESKANQQQTLFRFVSLRAPELSDPVDQDQRFVFNTGYESGVFYEAVRNLQPGETKRDALRRAAEGFTPFGSVDELERRYPDHTKAAVWIARNRSSFKPEELYNMVKGLDIFEKDFVSGLWNNLYYQVIKHDNFYMKECLMQFLVLQNMLVILKRLPSDEERIKVLPYLANARVVLPTELFGDEDANTDSPLKPGDENVNFSTRSLRKSAEVADAQLQVDRNSIAIIELKKLQRRYQADYDKLYNAAVVRYEEQVAAAYDAATVVEKTRTECPSGCTEVYYEYENLNLPNFDFKPPLEIDPKKLKAELTPESYYVLEELDLLIETTYDAIIAGIEASTSQSYQSIYADPQPQERIAVIGNMLFRTASSASEEPGGTFPTSADISFLAYFVPATTNPLTGRIQIVLMLGYPNADATKATFTAEVGANRYTYTEPNMTDTPNGNFLNILFFANNTFGVAAGETQIKFDAKITLSDNTVLQIICIIPIGQRVSGIAKIISQIGSGSENGDNAPFIPPGFGLRRLGIADYKKVVAEVCCYRPAEVAHIENIMAREFKSKTTTRERIEETTTTTERQTESETLTDTATSERFEMQTEIAKILQQEKDFNAYANVHASYNKITLDTGAAYATNSSKEESNRQAVTQAKEITQRAMERLVTKFREEVVTKITESFKDENSHIFDNREGENNVSGVYRYINAIYKNQIFNYGKRLMYEFLVPQPSRLYRYGMKVIPGDSQQTPGDTELVPPLDPKSAAVGLTSASVLTPDNYMSFASRYNASVEAPPAQYITIGKSYRGEGKNGSNSYEFNDIKVPEGYRAGTAKYQGSIRRSGNNNLNADFMIGNFMKPVVKSPQSHQHTGNVTQFNGSITINAEDKYSFDSVPVSVIGWDLGAFALNVTVRMERTEDFLYAWKLRTFDIIMKAYYDRLAEFNSQKEEAVDQGEQLLGTNPLFYRQVEQATLKKICLSYLMPESEMGASFYSGTDFLTFQITQDQSMDDYASKAKFMEQAFEWDIMSYNFYPYYWGKRADWYQLYQTEKDDPLFRSFMQAGMARVVVSVKPGFEDAVMYYMKFGEIWNGGEMPVIGDPLYLSIVDELAEQEYTVEQTWETVVPTSLIGLQKDGVSIDESGLPCGGGCEEGQENKFKPNDHKLGPGIPVVSNN